MQCAFMSSVAGRQWSTSQGRVRRRPTSIRRTAVVVALVLIGLPNCAANFEGQHSADIAANPPDLHFSLSSATGLRTFHLGERIPLSLAFSSDTPGKYKLNAASYDRSGRLPTEEFIMETKVVD